MASSSLLNSNDAERLRPRTPNLNTSRQYIEDVTIIWLDPNSEITEYLGDVENTKNILRSINDYCVFYSQPDPCIEYIKAYDKENIFLITSGAFARVCLPEIHDLKQIDSVFIYCVVRSAHLPLKDHYAKVIDVVTEPKDLVVSLRNNIEYFTKQRAMFGLLSDHKQRATQFLSKESASFLWFQLLTDVLQNIASLDTNCKGIQEMLDDCEKYYRKSRDELENIDRFRKNYKPKDAIVWYSEQSFVYRLVNKALRTEDIDALYTFRVYIAHLRKQIELEHSKLLREHWNDKSSKIHLYRGVKMPQTEIDQMCANIDCLISINGFCSTSRDIKQAIDFANKSSHRPEVRGVLFEIIVDIHTDKLIFADIADISVYPDQKEVLFDLATIFKIDSIKYDEENQLWRVNLTGVKKSSYTVNEFIKGVNKETKEKNPSLLLSRLMCDMGEYTKSIKYLKRLESTASVDNLDISKIYFYLGRANYLHGDYREAIDYYNKAAEWQKKAIAPEENSYELARTYHEIGSIFFKRQNRAKALEYYDKSLAMKRKVLDENSDDPSIATTLAAKGTVYLLEKRLSEALELIQTSYEMRKLSLVADHPLIADSLNRLGTVYQAMNNFQQAKEFFEKALAIKKETLPSTHPSIATTLNDLGCLYQQQGCYKEALECYTEALDIQEKALSPYHSDLFVTCNNLHKLYFDNGESEKATEMEKRKLAIEKNFDPRDRSRILQAQTSYAPDSDH